MASADILRLLAATVGATASADTQPTTQQLREGLFVTALPQGPPVAPAGGGHAGGDRRAGGDHGGGAIGGTGPHLCHPRRSCPDNGRSHFCESTLRGALNCSSMLRAHPEEEAVVKVAGDAGALHPRVGVAVLNVRSTISRAHRTSPMARADRST